MFKRIAFASLLIFTTKISYAQDDPTEIGAEPVVVSHRNSGDQVEITGQTRFGYFLGIIVPKISFNARDFYACSAKGCGAAGVVSFLFGPEGPGVFFGGCTGALFACAMEATGTPKNLTPAFNLNPLEEPKEVLACVQDPIPWRGFLPL